MNYWLLKSDPETYSFDDLIRDKKTIWDGVRNYQARNNLALMKKGDIALVYHSQEGAKEVVGIAEISRESFPDPSSDDNKWLAIEIKAKKKFKKFVTLTEIKKSITLKDISLIKQSRLSVMPLTEAEYVYILKLGEMS